ncbi:transglycosylase domain-containing protein [Halobacillus naozhouensis]|uniref:Transglycosylase domain-containing protein n=1 Tax=Halobacillus naozhouensis TaxID=554880 RepID=A0ABY8J0W5_9BACI|nr:transglycosylase domain-containing protein [Halobacillus naozhouensis]WFT74405.1 transglycosylase domain-containing protein [Halobacillus naozhouensis]
MLLFIRLKWKWIRRSMKAAFTCCILGLIVLAAVFIYAVSLGPPSLHTEQNTIYYGADGKVIDEDHGAQERYWISKEEMPESIVQATLAIEDHRFYDHWGFDLRRIASAALTDLKAMKMVEGASTITQQYARNLYLSHEKTWARKIKEAFYAMRLEIFYEKDEIIEGYLNTIYYGHGAYGIEAASRYYFDKHAEELTLAEASMLAGIPKGPSYYSPLNNSENAEERQSVILSRMEELGYISAEKEQKAVAVSLDYYDHSGEAMKTVAPYFQDKVTEEAARILDTDVDSVKTGGYHIYTTLNKSHQKELEQSIDETIANGSEIQTASVIMDSQTGAVTALAGGKDHSKSAYNRVTDAQRMVGSTIKPFLYYAALMRDYTPLTMIASKPTSFELKNGKVYSPSNYNNYYANRKITMAQALALSDNIYAVTTNVDIGPKNFVEALRTFGISGKLPAVPSLALGTASISLYEMVDGYMRMVSGSAAVRAHTITKITDRHGEVVYKYKLNTDTEKSIDPNVAFTVTHMMTGMFDKALNGYMSVTGASISDQLTRMYGGKSGTTDADSWMIGFSPQYTMGVWTGYDDNRDITKTAEHQYSKQLWASTMETIHQPLPVATFTPTPGVKGVYINPKTGKLSGSGCPKERLVYMAEENIPTETCEPNEKSDEEQINRELQDDSWLDGIVDWFS